MATNKPLLALDAASNPIELGNVLKAYMHPYNPRKNPIMVGGWHGIIIMHRTTRRFYSTCVKNLENYYSVVTRQTPGFERLALPLRRMLNLSGDFSIYTVTEPSRIFVENLLVDLNWSRVITGKGELQKNNHFVHRVHCPVYNFSRYVIGPFGMSRKDILKRANKSISEWLVKLKGGERNNKIKIRDSLGWNKDPKRVIFDDDTSEIFTEMEVTKPANQYASITRKLNSEEITRFLLSTNGVVFQQYPKQWPSRKIGANF